MATGVDAKLLKSTKFPPEFNQKVDMQKVNLQVMKNWIAPRITEILGLEDDVVTELVFNLIEDNRYGLQIQLTGFLDKDTPSFCKELWNLLLSAQASPQGVPKELLEAKKLEILMQEKAEAEKRDKLAEHDRQRRQDFDRRDRGRGGGRGGGGRGDSYRGGRDDRGGGRGGAPETGLLEDEEIHMSPAVVGTNPSDAVEDHVLTTDVDDLAPDRQPHAQLPDLCHEAPALTARSRERTPDLRTRQDVVALDRYRDHPPPSETARSASDHHAAVLAHHRPLAALPHQRDAGTLHLAAEAATDVGLEVALMAVADATHDPDRSVPLAAVVVLRHEDVPDVTAAASPGTGDAIAAVLA
ncbi:hypothetical protein B0H66DRAFT_526216 [Apodospora peruviana]|uniref:PWI domain-containing protein n=1 Tax=Apodospora peruviana TaxID=516989 RepID=A0AAE0MDR4_9PEZI|nr:hypothetical protein B0H66DRAFT_526216 [Apodospora peruviana]